MGGATGRPPSYPVLGDPRSRAAFYRRQIELGLVEVKDRPDPRDTGEEASRIWRRKAAIAYLGTLTAGRKS